MKPELDISNGFAVMKCYRVDKCSAVNFQNLLHQSQFLNIAKHEGKTCPCSSELCFLTSQISII